MRRRAVLGLATLLAVTAARAARAAPPPAGPVLTRFGGGSFAGLKRSLAGRPAVVHFWGLTCAPCLVELPRWARFAHARPGAAIVFVQFDPMPPERVSATLARAGLARARHFTVEAPPDERLRWEIDPDWAGELPRTLIFAPDGVSTAFSGSADFAALARGLAAVPARR